MVRAFVIFLILNFGALAIGSIATAEAVTGEWYTSLNKAPWTPPGWIFGAAWTFIMICYSIYLSFLWPLEENKKKLILIYALQLVFNISWNPTFFVLQWTSIGFLIITLLTLLIGYITFTNKDIMRWTSFLMAPYFIWLLIATSLNAYVVFQN